MRQEGSVMLRFALRLLIASLVLIGIGWLSLDHGVFELIRLAAIGCMALGFGLLVVNFVRTPDPSGG